MSTTTYNFEVSQSNFNAIVLINSYKLPVFTLFMSPSIGSCIDLERILSEYADEFTGQFILARIDVDMQPELREQYQVVNVPTIKVFKEGQVVHQEIGLLNLKEVAELFKAHGIFRVSDEMREKAREHHLAGDTQEAINLLTQAIKTDPANPRVVVDMIQVMLDLKLLEEAKQLFNRLPDKEKQSESGKSILGQLTFQDLAAKTAGFQILEGQVANDPQDFDARFDLAICYVADHDYENGMSQIFSILDQEPTYREGAAQELAVSIINMLEANSPKLAQDSRRILSNMLSK